MSRRSLAQHTKCRAQAPPRAAAASLEEFVRLGLLCSGDADRARAVVASACPEDFGFPLLSLIAQALADRGTLVDLREPIETARASEAHQ